MRKGPALIARCALFTALFSVWASVASAQHAGVRIGTPFAGQRATELNLHGGFVSPRGLGPAAGVRVAIPVVDNGFVSSIDNAIYITFGGDLMFERCFGCGARDRDFGLAIAIPITGRWQFNFNPSWSAYGEVGPNIWVHSGWLGDGDFPGFGHHWHGFLAATVGGKWHFDPQSSLTLAVGAPYIAVGIDFLL